MLRYVCFFGIGSGAFIYVIPAAQTIDPDCEQIQEHLDRIADDMHFAVLVEIPGYGDLFDLISASAGNIQDLDVKGPAGDGLL